MKKSETIENYLEAIYILSLKKKSVKAIDVVNYLGFSRPTVSIALKNLENDSYVKINGFDISLTDEGLKVAKSTYEKHELIAKVLISLGVSEEVAYHDSCLIEHDLSDESFKAIKKAAKLLNK